MTNFSSHIKLIYIKKINRAFIKKFIKYYNSLNNCQKNDINIKIKLQLVLRKNLLLKKG
jgi:hypothetical protein